MAMIDISAPIRVIVFDKETNKLIRNQDFGPFDRLSDVRKTLIEAHKHTPINKWVIQDYEQKHNADTAIGMISNGNDTVEIYVSANLRNANSWYKKYLASTDTFA